MTQGHLSAAKIFRTGGKFEPRMLSNERQVNSIVPLLPTVNSKVFFCLLHFYVRNLEAVSLATVEGIKLIFSLS